MAITIRKISDEQSRLKYSVNLHGKSIITTVTSSPSVVRKWLGFVIYSATPHWALRNLVVGLGVQWVPKPSSSSTPPEASTLQLCIGRRCLIFQLTHAKAVPSQLRRFLLHPNYTFVGMWNHSDRKTLERSRHYAGFGKTGDSLVQAPRETIIHECIGWDVTFVKGVGRSEWDDCYLSDEQIMEATVDAHASFLVGKGLKAWKLYNKLFSTFAK